MSSAPTRTSTPSARSTRVTTSAASGSSGPSSRSSASTSVTRVPNRANACASSHPIGPPPSTTSDAGASVCRITSRLVQYGVPASPSIGGHRRLGAGVEHDAEARVVRRAVDLDPPGPASRP